MRIGAELFQPSKLAAVDREEKLNEQELFRAAKNGDKNAFKELIKKYEHQVAATVIGMLGNCPEAEDVGQETFIRLYQSLDKFRGEASLGTYLTRIAINLSLNELKRRQQKRGRFFSRADEVVESIPDKNNQKQRKELKDIVHMGIRKLDPKYRTVVVLRLIDGYSTQETAQILKLPVGTVLSRLARAQMKLKEILTPLYWDKNDI
ncbi:MAG: sigma-70 family RNA polymerase sigma factor [Candidatus Aminicenantes bacterium]|nr:sigma-70 family RNA polymerase sigma factor [Candidatus Aminicenantes bacterium]